MSTVAAEAAPEATPEATPEAAAEPGAARAFNLHLANFEGPFDLLLSLISKHKLDVTEVALSQVTDEFIAHIKGAGGRPVGSEASGPGEKEPWDLEQTTSFLLVASTLLDLKAARLLPQGEVDDEEDLSLLEARDLLFARLLQYRAFKQVAGLLEQRISNEERRHPRSVGLEERFATLLPDVLIGLGLEEFAGLAAAALEPKAQPEIGLAHLHAPAVSVREQATIVIGRLRGSGTLTFRALAADAPDTMTRVARFLSLLELFREGVIAFDQMTPLGELSIRWTGTEDTEVEITDEFDGAPPEEPPAPATEERP
jgi:segregation and condensation protein A